MKRFLEWYCEDGPAVAFSNKQIFWFALGATTALLTDIIQSL